MRHVRFLRYIDVVARSGSIRSAAEKLNLTASALNRRIQDFEEELGTPIFERLPRGVRLNAAGELMIRHFRAQLAELSRVRSQVEDLSGFRRGTISIACSQALAYDLMPSMVAAYRREFPLVNFSIRVLDHRDALRALTEFEVDLALVFRPPPLPEFQILGSAEQRVRAIMQASHPLANRAMLRLRDCADFPLALPDRSYSGRQLLDEATARASFRFEPAVESNSFEFLRNFVRTEWAVTFQIEIGAPPEDRERYGLVAKPIDPRDIQPARLAIGQLRGRALPVAAAKFADQLGSRLITVRVPATSPP
ncbi:MAG: LysR family transcriptional regulator [Methylobacterium sp.]|jgi:DNA-binding transcriptional LysR family regulator|nr:LysR family transcriptional regulator [Methylobacterium sp.]MCA3604220.1 LysR family transcriptional regulator [Methylobacterium sp.]MCA3614307.1 LysR family transcriptional regulator [Methylobacterium sp.]MCA3627806.1 LysR family transcriptional regulator [Methylobacterium sp.]